MEENIILETVNSPVPNPKDEYTYNKIYQSQSSLVLRAAASGI
jgi:hypothetical protein